MERKTLRQIEFGDFQTPDELAEAAAHVIRERGGRPQSIVEPTCGTGSFLVAAIRTFPEARRAVGLEINPCYFRKANARLTELDLPQAVDLRRADFFTFDWQSVFASLPEPILVMGNPPWVTASELGAMKARNLPSKSNFQHRRGLDALTGKSNFDIAEWMMLRLLEWLSGRHGTLAMLLKTTVARKVLLQAWQRRMPLADAAMYLFDAKEYFGVAVNACLLVCDLRPHRRTSECKVLELQSPGTVAHTIAFHDGVLVANSELLRRHEDLLQGSDGQPPYRWRSGIKHDCAKVMELLRTTHGLVNGLGETVSIENDYLYPMMKGSEVASGSAPNGKRLMVVTQRHPGDDTKILRRMAPKAWAYLEKHAEYLDQRSSSIYRNRARFSMFGVGPYAFTSWKVAICGLYKKLEFAAIGPVGHKPVVLDDTCYHLACESEAQARLLSELVNSQTARDLYGAFVFWDAKRPITVELLSRLNIHALARRLGRCRELAGVSADRRHSTHLARRLF